MRFLAWAGKKCRVRLAGEKMGERDTELLWIVG